MFEFDETFYKTVIENMKATAFTSLLREFGIPDNVVELFGCLIRAGCPANAIVKGLMDYGEYLEKQEKDDE